MISSMKCLCFQIFLFLMCLFTGILYSSPGQATVKDNCLFLELENDRLSLTADKAPLKIVLHELHAITNLGFEIPEKYLELSISVSFNSLPLEKGIQRILHRLNYACVFDQNGKLMNVVIVPNGDKLKVRASNEKPLDVQLSKKETFQTLPAPSAGDLVAALKTGELEAPREIEDYLKTMETVSASEAQDMMKQIRIMPFEQSVHDPVGETDLAIEDLQKAVASIPEDL